MVAYKAFTGTSAATLKFGDYNVRDVKVLGIGGNITSANTLANNYNSCSKYNIFFNYTQELGNNYTIN